MIVYHGSNHRFKKLRINKNLVNNNSSIENEGYGIYFSKDIDIAKHYGQYIYTLEIDDDYIKDFNEIRTCKHYLDTLCNHIHTKTNVAIQSYIDLDIIATCMHTGKIAIADTSQEIWLTISNEEPFCTEISETKQNRICQILRNYDKKHLHAYMFPYSIPEIGVIKNIKESVVKITKQTLR